MKKSVIAAAVAAVVAAPAALADVTISGGLQAELVSVGGDATRTADGVYLADGGMSGNMDGGNFGFLSFKASEDLGGGLKALANYTLNTHTDSSTGVRESYVGLSGGFGTFLAGRLNHPYKTSTVGWDPFLATSLQARGNGGMAGALHGSEINNAVAYANSFGSVKLVAAAVIDEKKDGTNDDTTGNHAVSFSVNAPIGPVELAVAYIDLSEHGDLGVAADKASAVKVGLKFASGDLTVAGQVEMLDEGFGDGNVAYLTGSYKMGSNSISLAYGKTDSDLVAGSEDETYLAVGLNHSFSKMTSGYVGYRATNDVAGSDGVDETALGAGLRVKF